MSKIGRKPINVENATILINENAVQYKGPKSSGSYMLPNGLLARVDGKILSIEIDKKICSSNKQINDIKGAWGLHRALLANRIKGAIQGFENVIEIKGLGYKAAVAGKKITFTLGYSHKIDVEIPEGIIVEIDKSGQKIVVRSFDKELAGQFCSEIKFLREPDAYKGKGIKLSTDIITLKSAGKSS